MSKQPYPDVVSMPVKKFYNYLKWKSNLEEEKRKIISEQIASKGKKY